MSMERPEWAIWPKVQVPLELQNARERQNFTFINTLSGSNITMPVADYHISFKVQADSTFNYGIQLGMNLWLLLMILLMTETAKLKLLIYRVNIAAIVLGIVREVAMGTSLTKSIFYSPMGQWTYMAGDMDWRYWDRLSQACLYTDQVCALLVAYLVEILLFLHVRVILSTLRWKYWTPIMVFLVGGSVACLVMRTLWAYHAIRDMINLATTQWTFESFSTKMQKITGALIVESVAAYSLVFIGRVAVLLYRRHKMGVKQAKPLQILAFISLESMIIPIIIVSVQWAPNQPWADPQTWMFTAIPLLMPLGSIVSSHLRYRKEAGIEELPGANVDAILPRKGSDFTNSTAHTLTSSYDTSTTSNDVKLLRQRPGYSAHITSPKDANKNVDLNDLDRDLEKADERHDSGIKVTHDIEVASITNSNRSQSTLAL